MNSDVSAQIKNEFTTAPIRGPNYATDKYNYGDDHEFDDNFSISDLSEELNRDLECWPDSEEEQDAYNAPLNLIKAKSAPA